MSSVAVVAHSHKTLGGGLPELRQALADRGVLDPQWREVTKSRYAPREVERSLAEGAELVLAWGGDGLVQHCVDAIAGSRADLAIIPAGTANLLASNLGIPHSVSGAVEAGLFGERRRVDIGRMNGERFAVMAGIGFDARVIADAKAEMKRVLGRMAYVWSAIKNMRAPAFEAQIVVDGTEWYRGDASCVLFGNVGRAFGGITMFETASTEDGVLEIGVADPEGISQWGRTLARTAFNSLTKSPFVWTTKGHRAEVSLRRKVLYELDGGKRSRRKSFKVEVEPAAVTVRVPARAV
jgi:YegS/Rv2252/BmrU family lipid kinase